MITDDLQSTDHLTHSKETEDLCKNHGVGSPLLAVAASYLAENLGSGASRNGARNGFRVADYIGKWLGI